MGYTKLFSELVTSTIWQEKSHVKIVWITMLALKDRYHVVGASIPGLANVAGVSIPECQEAIDILSSPDEHSRTPDFEGRRIEKTDGGWFLLNGEKYREKLGAEDKREYNRLRQQRLRSQKKQHSATGRDGGLPVAGVVHSEAYTEEDTKEETEEEEREEGKKPSLPSKQSIQLQEIQDAWNDMATTCSVKRSATWGTGTTRRKAALARIKDGWWRENWRAAMAVVATDKFCNGDNDRGWLANIEWFVRPETALKMIEGGYDGKDQDRSDKAPPGADDWMYVEGVPE